MKIAPARVAAYEILLRVARDRAHSVALLAEYEPKLSSADRRLCHQLVLGTLRRLIPLDRLIDEAAGKRTIDSEVRTILRLGFYQLLHLDRVPVHAVVNDSVNLVVRARKSSARGFVNAILRKAQTRGEARVPAEGIDGLSVATSHPVWLLERWRRQFGEEGAREIAEFGNVQPAPSFRWTLRTTDAVRASVARCTEASRGEYLRELAANGKIYFQDPGSQIVARAVRLGEGESFLDVCAAPGGKATLVALEHSYLGVRIVAGDISERRTATLASNCRNQGADSIEIVRFDAGGFLPFAPASFDKILVDAPCSGTGTIRSNPEIRYNLSEADIRGFASKQLKILENASKCLKPGGTLVYATCSLETEENEEVCEAFLARNPAFRKIAPAVPEVMLTAGGFARTVPFRDGTDGFFLAAFTSE
jgi:16S rRNA (cytosine967-C5)-methyltransferase